MSVHLTDKLKFPDPSQADEDGLLAIGGDLSVKRLQLAYQNGIFPWYSDGEPILWYCPRERFVIMPSQIHISRSMQQLIKSRKYEIRWNSAFEEVINACASAKRNGLPGTWINKDMIKAYHKLHNRSLAHSVEVWKESKLVGGLYGVAIGKVFCGESMFSTLRDTSKLALIALCMSGRFDLIDCQLYNPHLEKMGAVHMSREDFLEKLKAQAEGK